MRGGVARHAGVLEFIAEVVKRMNRNWGVHERRTDMWNALTSTGVVMRRNDTQKQKQNKPKETEVFLLYKEYSLII